MFYYDFTKYIIFESIIYSFFDVLLAVKVNIGDMGELNEYGEW